MNRSDAWERFAQCRRLQPDVLQVLVSADIVDALLNDEEVEMPDEVRLPDHVTKEWCDRFIDYDALPRFQKKVTTAAIRMAGPFTVATSEGPLTCQDGWLCFDARGYPYPVAADEFELIYESAKEAA